MGARALVNLHIASLAGGWLALVAGFGGLRDCREDLLFRPQLPAGWRRLAFAVRFRGQRLRVEITPGKATYSVDGDTAIRLLHCSRDDGDELTVKPGRSVTRKWRAVEPSTPRPTRARRRAGARR